MTNMRAMHEFGSPPSSLGLRSETEKAILSGLFNFELLHDLAHAGSVMSLPMSVMSLPMDVSRISSFCTVMKVLMTGYAAVPTVRTAPPTDATALQVLMTVGGRLQLAAAAGLRGPRPLLLAPPAGFQPLNIICKDSETLNDTMKQ
jgi:hypothetical protein